MPVFDEAALGKEPWELKKKALFEDPDGLPILPADIAARTVSWKRPNEVLEADLARRVAEHEAEVAAIAAAEAAADADVGAAAAEPPPAPVARAPCVGAPVVCQGVPVRAISAGFVQEQQQLSSRSRLSSDGGGAGHAASSVAVDSLASVAVLQSVFRVLHNNEPIVPAGSFLWESITPNAAPKDGPGSYYNASGKYVVRLYEAGQWRQVCI